MIRTLIADDHAVVRAGVRQILAAHLDVVIVGEAGTGNEVLRLLGEQAIDVVLLDMSMPGRSGIDLIKDIRRGHPRVRVLVLSMHNEEQYGVRAICAGAHGYVTKTSAPEVLVEAIRKVAEGRVHISGEVAERLAYSVSQPRAAGPLHQRLSEREYQVFLMLAGGRSVTAIAEALRVSSKTVSTHKARILQKMGFTGLADLVRYAVQEGLVDGALS